jgi:hypothetical protein
MLGSIEADGRRELSQHGVLPCLDGGEGWGGGGDDDLNCDGRAVPPTLQRGC